jgi:hypothetical protein
VLPHPWGGSAGGDLRRATCRRTSSRRPHASPSARNQPADMSHARSRRLWRPRRRTANPTALAAPTTTLTSSHPPYELAQPVLRWLDPMVAARHAVSIRGAGIPYKTDRGATSPGTRRSACMAHRGAEPSLGVGGVLFIGARDPTEAPRRVTVGHVDATSSIDDSARAHAMRSGSSAI